MKTENEGAGQEGSACLLVKRMPKVGSHLLSLSELLVVCRTMQFFAVLVAAAVLRAWRRRGGGGSILDRCLRVDGQKCGSTIGDRNFSITI